jgi:hypothetical protein
LSLRSETSRQVIHLGSLGVQSTHRPSICRRHLSLRTYSRPVPLDVTLQPAQASTLRYPWRAPCEIPKHGWALCATYARSGSATHTSQPPRSLTRLRSCPTNLRHPCATQRLTDVTDLTLIESPRDRDLIALSQPVGLRLPSWRSSSALFALPTTRRGPLSQCLPSTYTPSVLIVPTYVLSP